MDDFIPSARQQAIFDEWENTDNNLLINAVAGSGKTSTLLKLLEKCQHRTLFVAFNKSVQEEIQSKIEEKGLLQGKALTLHSIGLSAIKGYYRKVSVNNGKNYDLLKKTRAKHTLELKRFAWKMRVMFEYCLLDLNDVSRIYLTETYEETKQNLFNTYIGFDENEDRMLEAMWNTFRTLRDEEYDKTVIEVDFIDMIFIPIHKNLTVPIYPSYLFVDEAQDLNLVQHKLIDKIIEQPTLKKWIAVGDKNQSIYGFSGSYAESFDLFKTKGDVVVEMPLDICYRCPRSIIDLANDVYNVMTYGIQEIGNVGEINNVASIKDNSMVICRNTGPLIDLYFQLLGQDKDCYLKGQDILNALVRFITPYKSSRISSALSEMEYEAFVLKGKTSDDAKLKYFIFNENLSNFKKLVKHFSTPSGLVADILTKIKSMFIDKQNATMLCTIHKAKGLEANVVYILEEGLIPSKFARTAKELVQEENLRYVARTRAKKEMYFLNLNE